ERLADGRAPEPESYHQGALVDHRTGAQLKRDDHLSDGVVRPVGERGRLEARGLEDADLPLRLCHGDTLLISQLVPIRTRPGRKDTRDDAADALVPRDRPECRAASGRRAGGRTRSVP